MKSRLVRFGSISFAFAMLVALVAPTAAAQDDDKSKPADDSGDATPKKRRKKAAADDDAAAAPTDKPATTDTTTDAASDEGEKPKKKRRPRRSEDEDGDEETTAKPAPKPAPVDETVGLKEVGPDSYAATSPVGRVKIDRELPTEVGKWGWSWFGDNQSIASGMTGAGDFKISMVGVRHWVDTKIGWEVGTGLTMTKAAGTDAAGNDNPTLYCWGFTGGALYSLARYEYVNIFAAGRATIVPICKPMGGDGPSVFQLGVTGEVAVEIFLDAFQFFHAGPMVKTSRSMSITLGSGLGIRYTHFGGVTVTDPVTGESTTGPSSSSTNVSTSSAVDSVKNFTGTPTGSVAFTYYF